jgi:hypothetical protein
MFVGEYMLAAGSSRDCRFSRLRLLELSRLRRRGRGIVRPAGWASGRSASHGDGFFLYCSLAVKESRKSIKPPPGLFFCFGSKGKTS